MQKGSFSYCNYF